MKNTKQIAETVLKKRDAEQEKIINRNRRVKRATAAASTLLVFCAFLYAARHFNSSHVQIPTLSDEHNITVETQATISDTENSTNENTTEHPTESNVKESTSSEATENSTFLTGTETPEPTENRSAETSGAEKTVTNNTAASAPAKNTISEQTSIASESVITDNTAVTTVVESASVSSANTTPVVTTVLPIETEPGITIPVLEQTLSFPSIKIYHSPAAIENDYTEMKKNEIVRIETNYNPIMSNWSGIGILLEFDSPNYPVALSTNEGHFTTWDIEAGSGIVTNVGKNYNIGNKGYIFWTPDQLNYGEDFESEIFIVGDSAGKSVEIGSIVVTLNDQHTLSAVLK